MPEIQLSQGTIHYRDEGSGPVLVFVHGLLVDGQVWEPLVTRLAPTARCIVPDLPLGSHRTAMQPGADLSPAGVAGLIAELIERLELGRVTLVGNDTGGALCQLVVAGHPERLGGLVLTNCDALEHFPPPALGLVIKTLAKAPGALGVTAALGRLRVVRRLAMAAAPLTTEPIPDELVKSWVAPLRASGVRRDVRKLLRGIDPQVTLAAAECFPGFDRPVLIAWGTEDRFFPIKDAERLAETFGDARLERIDGARTFVQLDAPDRLAELIAAFLPAAERVAS